MLFSSSIFIFKVMETVQETDYKLIPLTQGYVAIVDPDDYEWLTKWKWNAQKTRNIVYAVRQYRHPTIKNSKGYAKQVHVAMHRLILGIKGSKQTDHRDGNGLDNRKANLRPATQAQNLRNSRQRKRTVSGFKGVYPYGKGWKARISVRGKAKRFGPFNNKYEAAMAYDVAAKKYFKEFACFNLSPQQTIKEELSKEERAMKTALEKVSDALATCRAEFPEGQLKDIFRLIIRKTRREVSKDSIKEAFGRALEEA